MWDHAPLLQASLLDAALRPHRRVQLKKVACSWSPCHWLTATRKVQNSWLSLPCLNSGSFTRRPSRFRFAYGIVYFLSACYNQAIKIYSKRCTQQFGKSKPAGYKATGIKNSSIQPATYCQLHEAEKRLRQSLKGSLLIKSPKGNTI